jgi:hypothetical protein
VVAHLVPGGRQAAHQLRVLPGKMSDHEKRGADTSRRENIQYARRPFEVGAVVEREVDVAGIGAAAHESTRGM